MSLYRTQKGVTLVEMLVVFVILGLVLGGIYGLLNSANQMFLKTRALVESQQTTRVVLNYLTYRLRQLDGSGLVSNPRDCTDCHKEDQDNNLAVNDPDIPCSEDVMIPRRTILLETISTIPLDVLEGELGTAYQNISGGNYIRFWGDLLPRVGINDTFTDSPLGHPDRNGKWDLTVDKDGDGKYDPEEDREWLEDLEDDGSFDYYAEKWTLMLQKSEDGNYYELVETLSFDKTDDSGSLIESYEGKNQSIYSAYTSVPIAAGIVALGIKEIPRILDPASYPPGTAVDRLRSSCGWTPGGSSAQGTYDGDPNVAYKNISSKNETIRDGCHGVNALTIQGKSLNIYHNETAFSYEQFLKSHYWWNIKGFLIDVVTTDPTGRKIFRTQQFVTPRNIEVNQEQVESFY